MHSIFEELLLFMWHRLLSLSYLSTCQAVFCRFFAMIPLTFNLPCLMSSNHKENICHVVERLPHPGSLSPRAESYNEVKAGVGRLMCGTAIKLCDYVRIAHRFEAVICVAYTSFYIGLLVFFGFVIFYLY